MDLNAQDDLVFLTSGGSSVPAGKQESDMWSKTWQSSGKGIVSAMFKIWKAILAFLRGIIPRF
jgi:hypothetical protein